MPPPRAFIDFSLCPSTDAAFGDAAMPITFARAVIVTAGTSLLAACSPFNRPSSAPPRSPGPSDGAIVAIVMAASNADMSYARLAAAQTSSPAVRDFAARMITDHTAINGALRELVARGAITPTEGSASLAYRDESAREREHLRSLDGRDFDAAYLANEIQFHSKLVALIDSELIPRVRDTQLRQILVSVRPAVAAHAEHARKIGTVGAQ